MKTENNYLHYTDYVFKKILKKYCDGVLKFLNIPYKLKRINQSEITGYGPKIYRMDFTGDVLDGIEELSLILECQTYFPKEDDIKRFFQYITLIRTFKNQNVELYILLTEKAPYDSLNFKINEDCIYKMNVISLKDIKATDIFKKIEHKLKYRKKITEEDIAALQLIAYTSYTETTLEILKKANTIINKIPLDINEKEAIIYILDVLSANMLNEKDKKEYLEETKMLINPRDEYMKNEGIKEGINKGKEEGKEEGKQENKEEIAKKLLNKNMPLKEISEITELTTQEIKNLKTKEVK